MKNYTITEEQIKELAKGNKKLEKMFPEVFEAKLYIGKWYKSNDYSCHIFFVTKIEDQRYYYYGFNVVNEYMNDWYSLNDSGLKKGFTLATEEEVKTALIKEAKKRGFKRNVNFISVSSEQEFEMISDEFIYRNYLNALSGEVGCIFKEGVWAEILNNKYLTKKQAEAKLTELSNDGYEYKIID